MSGLLVLGAGGHGRVVAFAARSAGLWTDIAFLDDRFPEFESLDDSPVFGRFDSAPLFRGRFSDAVVALGDGYVRLDMTRQLRTDGFRLPVIAHPSATVSEYAVIGDGTVVLAGGVVHPGAMLGEACIVNTSATVDHDCRLGCAVHLSPGVHLGGEVTVGDFAWLGVGASVKNGVAIGAGAIVGVGAAVVTDLPDGSTAVGVPARVVSGG